MTDLRGGDHHLPASVLRLNAHSVAYALAAALAITLAVLVIVLATTDATEPVTVAPSSSGPVPPWIVSVAWASVLGMSLIAGLFA